jgi:uncharacterized protein
MAHAICSLSQTNHSHRHSSFGCMSNGFRVAAADQPRAVRPQSFSPRGRMTWALGLIAVGLLSLTALGQSPKPRPPVIDMHVHANPMFPPERTMAMFDSLNVRYIFLSTRPDTSGPWASVDAKRFLPALAFPCIGGTSVSGTCVFEKSGAEFPDVTWLRGELKAGRFRALGEVGSQYGGMSPADSRMEPYWALAEELDVPVGIHMGPGGPGRGVPMAVGDPLLLEPVLLRHKRLRVFVMHAGWPRLESMIALMYAHASVSVDVAALQIEFNAPRPAYMRHLRGLAEAGFGKRIMFGSDFPLPGGPRAADYPREGIDAILAADFLTAEQKADILCGNAARFLRLAAAVCRP